MIVFSGILLCILGLTFCNKKNSHSDYRAVWSNNTSKTVFNGAVNVQDKTFDSITINGSAQLKNVMVQDALQVNGALNAQHVQCASLSANGGITLTDSTIQTVHANGGLQITASKIDQLILHGGLCVTQSAVKFIDVIATEIILDASQVESIIIRPGKNNFTLFGYVLWDSSPKEQKLILRNGTVITGNVTFEQPGGKVIIESGSKVMGNIVGVTL